MTAVQTLLEDETGRVIKLSIYHAVAAGASVSEIEGMFPKRMNVAVKEPYFKRYTDGCVGLRVDDPADILSVDPVSLAEILGSTCTVADQPVTAAADKVKDLAEGAGPGSEPQAGAETTIKDKADGFRNLGRKRSFFRKKMGDGD